MAKNVSRPAAGLALSLALLSGCASAEGREFARGLLEGMAEASSTMAAMKGGKYAQYAQYAPIAQAAAQMFEPIPDLPRFQEEPEVPLGEIPEAVAPMAHGASSFRRAGMGRFTLQDVETIVGRLATANGLPRHPVSVISNPEPNAGAGGGRITVHTGFLDDVQNEHEIALVLGHEIAHNVLRHMETLPDHAAVARLLHRTNLNESILKGNTRLIVHAISGAIEGAYSRDQEREADAYGTRYALAAGFDPIAGTSWHRRRMAEVQGKLDEVANLGRHMSQLESSLATARGHRASADTYQARAQNHRNQAMSKRNHAYAIYQSQRNPQARAWAWNEYVRFENGYRYAESVYQQAWHRFQQAVRREKLAESRHNESRRAYDSNLKLYIATIIPFFRTHPISSERIASIVAITQQLGSGDTRLASAPMSVPSGGGDARASSAAMGQHTPQVAPLEPMSFGSSVPVPEAVAVALAEPEPSRDTVSHVLAEVEAQPEQEVILVIARPESGSLQARAVVEEGASPAPALTKQVFIRGLRTSQEISFGETGNVNIWAISGAVVNPTGRPVKQVKVRAIFYDEAGEEVHREEKSVSFSPGVAEARLSWNLKGVPIRAQRVEVQVIGADNLDREKPKAAKKVKRSA
ncbi:MAG: M48 family metalloprotease [Nitrospirota bacterium]